MSRDDEVVFSPRREKGEKTIPASGVLILTPGEARRGIEAALALGASRRRLFHSELAVHGQESAPRFVAGPAVGAPMAVMTLEKLIALGGRELFVFGWCGSLSPKLSVGDVLIPSWAASEEGTSAHYPVDGQPLPDGDLADTLSTACRHAGFRTVSGPVWTTDAPYRETRAKVRRYAELGVLAVDMEWAALLAVAAFRGIRLAAAFLVSDEPWREDWHPGFLSAEFRSKSRAMIDLLLPLCPRALSFSGSLPPE